ncbi:ribonuclease H-like protein [Russula earlei]|uniref:Ribonuclease H-like protein n=1 Tax=Russula earlei TaxID=71964 RepID=A0ACC0UBX8_9AGAM|nr:ribonuclease H-like protein [Russula earlei]
MSSSFERLTYYDGPLVWIDCEMTGLDYNTDRIIEIAVIITNGNLDIVDDGLEFVIRTEKAVLDNMGEWCQQHHNSSGLTAACLESMHTTSSVQEEIVKYIKKWVPKQRTAMLAGNSVHADRVFLAREMPEIVDWLHYRIVDVSSIKELHRRWYPRRPLPDRVFKRETKHRALDDIRGSIEELKWYRENIFISPNAYAKRSFS